MVLFFRLALFSLFSFLLLSIRLVAFTQLQPVAAQLLIRDDFYAVELEADNEHRHVGVRVYFLSRVLMIAIVIVIIVMIGVFIGVVIFVASGGCTYVVVGSGFLDGSLFQ